MICDLNENIKWCYGVIFYGFQAIKTFVISVFEISVHVKCHLSSTAINRIMKCSLMLNKLENTSRTCIRNCFHYLLLQSHFGDSFDMGIL